MADAEIYSMLRLRFQSNKICQLDYWTVSPLHVTDIIALYCKSKLTYQLYMKCCLRTGL
jgi:hypothetical protein